MDGVEEFKCMLLHLRKDVKVLGRIEEHALHDFCQNLFGCASHACIVEQVAHLFVGLAEEGVWQPTHDRSLIETLFRLQEFDAWQDASVLVLPTTTRREQLFKDEGAVANLELVPSESAEVCQCSDDGRCQDGTGAQS